MTDRRDSLQRVAGPVSRETFEALLHFEQVFLKWSSRINLTAASTLPSLWDRHILDSAQLLPLGAGAASWTDFGSGGGFPGAILAILLREREGAHVDLIESNTKKAAFLKTALGDAAGMTKVHAIRAEAASAALPQPQIVTARAVAPLGVLLRYAAPWLSTGSRALFHKGRDYRKEIEETGDAWRFDLVEHRSMVERDAVVLEIAHLRRAS